MDFFSLWKQTTELQHYLVKIRVEGNSFEDIFKKQGIKHAK